MNNHFNTRSTLQVNQQTYTIFNLNALPAEFAVHTLPYSLKILLENLLRCENGHQVTAADIEALAKHDPTQPPTQEIAFTPSRVLLQDFTGVPAIVDLAAMRDGITAVSAMRSSSRRHGQERIYRRPGVRH